MAKLHSILRRRKISRCDAWIVITTSPFAAAQAPLLSPSYAGDIEPGSVNTGGWSVSGRCGSRTIRALTLPHLTHSFARRSHIRPVCEFLIPCTNSKPIYGRLFLRVDQAKVKIERVLSKRGDPNASDEVTAPAHIATQHKSTAM